MMMNQILKLNLGHSNLKLSGFKMDIGEKVLNSWEY